MTGRNMPFPPRFFLDISMVLIPFLCLGIESAGAGGRIVKVGVYENAPKVFTSESGRPAGIFIDLIEHVAEKEGWTLYYVPGTWGEGLDRLENGAIDLMPDVAYSADRGTRFSFNKEPVLSSWFQIYARKGSGVKSILDLAGKRIAVLDRSVQEEAFLPLAEGFGVNTAFISAPDYKSSFEMVVKHEADAVITNRFFGAAHARKFDLEDTAVIFHPSALFFAAAKGANADLLPAIDRYLRDLKRDHQSVYYESLKRWTAEEVRFKLPAWIETVGLLAAVVLVMSLAGSVVLKWQVNARTKALSKRNRQLAIMDRTLRATTTRIDLQAVLDQALRGAMEISGVEGGALCLLDRRTDRLHPGAFVAPAGDSSAELGYPAGQVMDALCGHAVRDGGPLIIWDNAAANAGAMCERLRNAAIRFYAAFPMQVRNETIGVLCLFSQADVKPDPRKLDLVQDICAPVALAIENALFFEQIQRHNKELERQVAERTAEWQAAAEKARAADRIKSAFLATMSHELRTPLNSIIGFTGILLQGLAGPLNEEQRKQLNMVQNSSRHLLSLINDVLDISKIEAGQLALSVTSFQLRPSIENTAKLVSPLAERKGIELRLDIADDIGTVTTDQRRLEQVILNLLNNAVKFTEKGYVHLSCRIENHQYLLSISDTGIGIQPEELDGLFQPFHQIDTGLTRRHEGTGLGLSICKKLLDMMGGAIDVRSRWGQGSTFTIRFPRQAGDAL